jgi:DNA (cytosine-5)-methyltransferase 1
VVGEVVVTVTEPPRTKPDYRVSTMAAIRALPWNGLTAASTFSGCGGSSTGYRMAGFRVLYASEFIPEAQATYRANAAPYTYLDERDIRDVTAGDLLGKAGVKAGELDLLDGSPPCASFSTAGKRHKGWGVEKAYSDTVQRSDDLFFEFARLVKGVQPRVFVAENVSGLVKGSAKGYFMEIMKALKGCGYRVEAKLLDAQWLGVPQARQRLIFVGVRDDLGKAPAFPSPLPYRYSVRDALPWIVTQGDNGGFGGGEMRPADVPSPTIGASPNTGNGRFPPSKVEAICLVHDTSGEYGAGDVTDRPVPTITSGVNSVNSRHYQVHGSDGPTIDPETGDDLTLNRVRGERVRNVRRLTLGELRALGGFPPDFILTGTYGQRWERVGRAVPPVMMSHIASAIRGKILATCAA